MPTTQSPVLPADPDVGPVHPAEHVANWVFLVSESRLSAPRYRGDDPPLNLGVRGLGIETVGTQIAEWAH
jgi:hypothetical protein